MKRIILSIMLLCLVASASLPVYAKDKPQSETKPTTYYGNPSGFDPLPSLSTEKTSLLSTAIMPLTSVVPSTTAPSIPYGDQSSFNNVSYYGPWQPDNWHVIGYHNKYSNWNSDQLNSYQSGVTASLSTSTTFTWSITGSAEYNFATVAKASLSGTIGQSTTKTYSFEFVTQTNKQYNLWAATLNKVLDYQYYYISQPWPWSTPTNVTLNASAYDKQGTVYWIFSKSI